MNKEIKYKVDRRLKIIAGQVGGLQKMVQSEEYCIDIITQTSAIRRALASIEDVMLENHLSSCMISQIKSGETDKMVTEIMSVYKLAKKK